MELAWWVWSVLLFAVTFGIGIIGALSGIGGGILFIPIVSGFFPYHLDFVRGAGLVVALAGSLAASPRLLRNNLASLRLVLPFALVSSGFAMAGAYIGLSLPTSLIQTLLGLTIMAVSLLFLVTKHAAYPHVAGPDSLSQKLAISGTYVEESTGQVISWQVQRMPGALFLYAGIGLLAGMFGLGAGWANIPVFNLVMGVPLKLAVGSSKFLLSITDTSAAWVYLNQGAVLPIVVVPSVLGIMLGSRVGVRLLSRTRPGVVRYLIIVMLFFSGLRSLLAGLGLW
jgi:uncharacterized protein